MGREGDIQRRGSSFYKPSVSAPRPWQGAVVREKQREREISSVVIRMKNGAAVTLNKS